MLVVFSLFFLSGFTALVYQVLWLRELRLLFGATAHAAATTLAAFFLGLAIGGWWWGRQAERSSNPLRTYAMLESGVAVTALLLFLLVPLYRLIYTPLYGAVGNVPWLFTTVKFALACAVLLPPACLMGGTLPVMSQHLIRSPHRLGRVGAALYAVNTLGAATGAYLAGFHLPLLLGFRNTYLTAIGMTAAVAFAAWFVSRWQYAHSRDVQDTPSPAEPVVTSSEVLPVGAVRALAMLSGFVTLGLEVLWTRMFQQVLHNSVYTFATILVTFLVCLALGAAIASLLARRSWDPVGVLFVLVLLAGLLVGVSPWVFYWATDGLGVIGAGEDWTGYMLDVWGVAVLVMFPPGIVLGTILPYILRVVEPACRSVGRTVGDLIALNTLAAIFGSIAAGFVLLTWLGLWPSIRLMAVLYVLAALLLTGRLPRWRTDCRVGSVGALLVLVFVLDPSTLPRVRVDHTKGDALLGTWEGPSGVVAVVRRNDGALKIKVNNYYTLGNTSEFGLVREQRQGHLPLLIHQNPKSVFFLGMGTGVTAGSSLSHASVERVTVAELVPEVITAARKHFGKHTNGLFEDERVTVLAEDGRNHLAATDETFDVIVADLFVPWKAGTGNLYTAEHYAAAKKRLNEFGIYAQWLALYQLSEREFLTIARTMLEVFPMVTVWRGDFFADNSTSMLVGHRDPAALMKPKVLSHLQHFSGAETRLLSRLEMVPRPATFDHLGPLMIFYAGNLTGADDLVLNHPINTDDLPLIEYRAPIAHRRSRAQSGTFLVGKAAIDFYLRLSKTCPPGEDAYLALLNETERNHVRAGFHLQRARQFGDDDRAAFGRELKRAESLMR